MTLVDIGTERASDATFQEYLQGLREALGVAHAAYAGMGWGGGMVRGFTTYPDDWVAHYRSEGLVDRDPTLHLAARSIAPLDWSRIPLLSDSGEILTEARQFGIPENGITVPVRGPYGDIGMLSVVTDGTPETWQKQKQDILRDLHYSAVHIHDNVMRVFGGRHPALKPLLSRREIEILQWIAAGKTQRDIGSILAISDRTVEVHLRSARTKLDALTTAQAVGRALASGLIEAN